MKGLLTIVAVMCVGMVSAQEGGVRVPVEDDILAKTLSSDSPYFYRPLMERYMKGDTSLTDEEYHYLYYGYAYEPEYDAHRELPGQSVMAGIFGRTTTLAREDAPALIEAGKQNMAVDPFSPGNINMMTLAYELAGDSLNVAVSADRFRKIVRAITSSGTGLKEKSPWHILRFSHANDIIAARGLKITNRGEVRTRDVYYIQVDPNPARVKGYFFDFSRVYWKPFEGEKVKKKSKWMFNGFPM